MTYYYSLLFLVLMANLYLLFLSVHIREKIYRVIISSFMSISLIRYFILYIFAISESPQHLYVMKNMALSSTISIPVVSYICIKVLCKGKMKLFDVIFTAIIFLGFAYIVCAAPLGIISTDTGYKVLYKDEWLFIISIIQCLFSGLMIYNSLSYFMKERAIGAKVTYFTFLIGYIGVIVENLLNFYQSNFLPENIISEGILLIAIILSVKQLSLPRNED